MVPMEPTAGPSVPLSLLTFPPIGLGEYTLHQRPEIFYFLGVFKDSL